MPDCSVSLDSPICLCLVKASQSHTRKLKRLNHTDFIMCHTKGETMKPLCSSWLEYFAVAMTIKGCWSWTDPPKAHTQGHSDTHKCWPLTWLLCGERRWRRGGGVCVVLPSGSSFQLFVGGQEALGRAAAVCTHTHKQTHTHSSVIANDTGLCSSHTQRAAFSDFWKRQVWPKLDFNNAGKRASLTKIVRNQASQNQTTTLRECFGFESSLDVYAHLGSSGPEIFIKKQVLFGTFTWSACALEVLRYLLHPYVTVSHALMLSAAAK